MEIFSEKTPYFKEQRGYSTVQKGNVKEKTRSPNEGKDKKGVSPF